MSAPPASTAPLEGLSEPRREALRAAILDELPARYSPALQLLGPTAVGLVVITACVAALDALRAVELVVVPVLFTLANATEWRLHKDVLHRRRWPLEALYDQHTPMHHMVFPAHDMALRSRKELALVLFPPWALGVLLVGISPLAAGLWAWLGANVALLFVASCTAYLLVYEWLHLAYHLPRTNPLARLRVVRALAWLHTTHHDPRLMQRANFNVSVPLWDLVRGTMVRGPTATARPDDAAATHAPRDDG